MINRIACLTDRCPNTMLYIYMGTRPRQGRMYEGLEWVKRGECREQSKSNKHAHIQINQTHTHTQKSCKLYAMSIV